MAPEAARPPAGSADLVDRIVRVVEQQARLTPPRSVVVGLDGDRGRLAVTLRGTGIHLAWDGANLAVAEVRAFQRAVVAALASRGFEIAGDTPQDRSRREPARRQARHRRPARGQIH